MHVWIVRLITPQISIIQPPSFVFVPESLSFLMQSLCASCSCCSSYRRLQMDDFKCISVLGRGHFGKVWFSSWCRSSTELHLLLLFFHKTPKQTNLNTNESSQKLRFQKPPRSCRELGGFLLIKYICFLPSGPAGRVQEVREAVRYQSPEERRHRESWWSGQVTLHTPTCECFLGGRKSSSWYRCPGWRPGYQEDIRLLESFL